MQLQPGEASDSENVRSDTGLEIMKRKGYVALATSVSPTSTAKANMATAKSSHGGFSAGSFNYSTSGIDSGSSTITTHEKYNIRSNVWETKTAITTGRKLSGYAVLSQLLYMIGGANTGGTSLTTNERYNVDADAWISRTAITAAKQLSQGFQVGTKSYFPMGKESVATNTNYEYNSVANTFSTKTASTASLQGPAEFNIINNGYCVSGLSSGNPSDTNEQYNSSTNVWTNKTILPETNFDSDGMSISNFGYVIGGGGLSSMFTIYRYTESTNAWTANSSSVTDFTNNASGSFIGFGFYHGGLESGSTTSNKCEAYDTGNLLGIYNFQKSNLQSFIVIITQKFIRYWTGSSFSSLNSVLTGSYLDRATFATYNDIMYVNNNSDIMQKWDGVTAATVTVQGNIYETRSPVVAMTARSGVAAFSLNNSGFICGGTTGSVSQVVERYDDLPNTFTAQTAMAGAARQLLSGFSHSGFGYVCGGTTGAVSAVCEQFNPIGNAGLGTWKTIASLNTARSGLASSVSTLYGYASGGTTGAVSAVHEQYDPVLNTWTAKTAMTTARQDVAAGTVTDQHVFGGSTGSDSAVNERYSESGNAWTTRSAMNTARDLLGAFHATEGITEDIYAVGGHVAAVSALTERYRYAVDIWISRGAMTTARSSLAGFTIGNKGYAAGGTTGSVSAVLEKYFAGATPPKFKYLMVHKGYAFGCGSADYPSRDFWSSLGDLDNWPPENYEDIASDDGDATTGQFEHNGTRHVTKQDRIYQTVFSDDPANKQIIPLTPGIGCVSNASIVKANHGRVYFRGEQGFYEYGDSIRIISDKIDTTFFSLNQNMAFFCVGSDNKRYGEVWWAVATANSTANNEVLAYSYRLSTPDNPVWFRYTSILASAMAEIEDSATNLPTLYHGDFKSRIFYHDESVDNDDGTAITSSWTSGDMALHANEVDAVTLSRMLAWIQSTTASGNLTGNIYHDFSASAADSPSFSLASTGRVDKNLSGQTPHTVKIKLSHSTASESFQVNKIALGVLPLDQDNIAL